MRQAFKLNAFSLLFLSVGVLLVSSTKQAPLGIRNNNAGNIRATGKWQEWVGAVDENKGFIVFDTPINGLRALARTLRTYRDVYGVNTIHGIINRYAPPTENVTTSYVEHMVEVVGKQPFEPLADVDYPSLMAGIIKHENGEQPYSSQEIYAGYELGFSYV